MQEGRQTVTEGAAAEWLRRVIRWAADRGGAFEEIWFVEFQAYSGFINARRALETEKEALKVFFGPLHPDLIDISRTHLSHGTWICLQFDPSQHQAKLIDLIVYLSSNAHLPVHLAASESLISAFQTRKAELSHHPEVASSPLSAPFLSQHSIPIFCRLMIRFDMSLRGMFLTMLKQFNTGTESWNLSREKRWVQDGGVFWWASSLPDIVQPNDFWTADFPDYQPLARADSRYDAASAGRMGYIDYIWEEDLNVSWRPSCDGSSEVVYHVVGASLAEPSASPSSHRLSALPLRPVSSFHAALTSP